MEGQVARFTADFREFLLGVATGHESGLYKSFVIASQPLDVLRDEKVVSGMLQGVALKFFNDTYDGMAMLSGLPGVVPPRIQMQGMSFQFHEMCTSIDHSPVCLINIAFRLYFELHLKIARSGLDLSSYDAYMASVKKELAAGIIRLGPLEALFSHECKGDAVCEPFPPGKQMFYLLPADTEKCETCKKPREIAGVLRKCSRCKMVRYCGIDCQRAHWPVHKHVCSK
jgi:hypothetical protein